MLNTPLVSVVIPTYNRLAYLQEAVESVVGASDVQDEDDGDSFGKSVGSFAGYPGSCGSGHS